MKTASWAALPAVLVFAAVSAQEPALVHAATAQTSTIAQTLELTGSVSALRDAELSPAVSGLVQRVRVDAGDRVTAGTVLLELDDALARLALRRADAALEEARTRVDEARRLRDEGDRLAADGSLPRSQFLTREADYAAARATLGRLEAERANAAEQLARHRLVAPFDGVVVQRHSDEGEWIATGDAVLQLVATDPLRIDVRVPQNLLGAMDEQTRVSVRLDAMPGRALDGKLSAAVPVADPVTRTFLARVEVDNEDGRIAPGMSARARFEIGAPAPVVLVPRDAVRRYPDGTTTVWLIEARESASVAREIRVELGGTQGDRLVVLSGLADGARVIVRGNEGLRENQPVREQQGG